MYSYIGKSVSNDHLGSSTDPCGIQNHVITDIFIKRLRCIFICRSPPGYPSIRRYGLCVQHASRETLQRDTRIIRGN